MIRRIYQTMELYALTAFIMGLLSLGSLLSRRRFTHQNGITVEGKLRIVDEPEFPAHEFFRPGREFPCRVRYATVLYHDDTMLTVRGASIKFADTDLDSPLDLLLNTGATSLFWSAWTFTQFLWGGAKGRGKHFVPYFRKYPGALAGTRASGRRNPETFAQLYFYSKVVHGFVDRNGKMYYLKYRLSPEDRGPETGIATPEDLEEPWIQDTLPGETRSRHYLKDELRERVEREGIRPILQIQLHEPRDDDTEEIFNSNVEWDEATHPWMDVAHLELTRALDFEEGQRIRFQMDQHPPSIPILPAKSIHDYNSVNFLRYYSNLPRTVRLWSYRLFGVPPRAPEETRSSFKTLDA